MLCDKCKNSVICAIKEDTQSLIKDIDVMKNNHPKFKGCISFKCDYYKSDNYAIARKLDGNYLENK